MSTVEPREAAVPRVGADARAPAAVLWDMDGTLVDTEPYWIAAEYAMAGRYGGTWNQAHALELVGSDLRNTGRYIRQHMGIDLEPTRIVDELLDDVVLAVRESVPWRPGALALLASLRSAGVPCGLVTMSYLRFVEPVLAALPADSFDVVVTGDAVALGKPHPEPYLTAARMLGVDPVDCVAIEDSKTGVASASAAGCAVLAVPCHVTIPPSDRWVVRDTLEGLSADSLRGQLRSPGDCE